MNNNYSFNLIVADDHCVVREGIIRALTSNFPDAHYVEASNGAEILKHLAEKHYDIVILDVSLPGRNGIEMLTEITSCYPRTKVIIFSMYPEDQFAVRAIRSGAAAYITKCTPLKELMNAISIIKQGGRYLPPSVAELLANQISCSKSSETHEVLSNREYQVFQLIASGKTVSMIARDLSLSVKTISVYRANILKKMNFKNNSEITHYAIKNSLVN